MTASTNCFLTIGSKLSSWSTIGCLPNDVPLTGLLTILLTGVLMVVPEIVVPEAHGSLTLTIAPLVTALLLVLFLNIKMNFLQKLSTLSGLTQVEHLLLIVSAV